MERGTVAPRCLQPSPRAARKSEWLRSTLAHHHRPDPGAENEIVVLATGVDQYLQEVFHHLAHPNHDDVVSAEDFTVLCALLGLAGAAEERAREDGRREGEREFQDICSGLPDGISFRDFHSRLCGYFRVRASSSGNGQRLPVTEETELVEREIRCRWPRVRRRRCVSFDVSSRGQIRASPRPLRGQNRTEASEKAAEEAAALRELVEDLRCALQGSDARCLALEVALRRERARNHPSSIDFISSSKATSLSPTVEKQATTNNTSPDSLRQKIGVEGEGEKKAARRRDARDPILRELKLIRSSRDGQMEEAIKFNRQLEEELCWAYQEVRKLERVESSLRTENAEIRRRAEEAREALRQGLQRVRMIQEQAETVPQLRTRIALLETELHQHRSHCICTADPTPQPLYPAGGDDIHHRKDAEWLQRAVEGRAASDEEEEERVKKKEQVRVDRRTEERQCCLAEVKKLIRQLHSCDKVSLNPVVCHLHDKNFLGRGHSWKGQTQSDGNRCFGLEKKPEEERSQLEMHIEKTEKTHLSLLEEKLTDALTLLLQLRNKNVSRRALGKILMDTLDMCSRSGHGPTKVLQVADALCVQLTSSDLLLEGEGDGGERVVWRRKESGTHGWALRSSNHQHQPSGHLLLTTTIQLFMSCVCIVT
ncbi:EF-hand and coiled-coil domain-containing protein 1 [Lampris incognitus]|uniref:EF-hand and coiled-coil domain-containing protein 1 n=1 Tax=Lampris incognitus TaxID=2546036 RepID=UPI0024B4B6C5|nr:EF-hand and coiled-coil domain-containing protein 1 [Lampris incognitus]